MRWATWGSQQAAYRSDWLLSSPKTLSYPNTCSWFPLSPVESEIWTLLDSRSLKEEEEREKEEEGGRERTNTFMEEEEEGEEPRV